MPVTTRKLFTSSTELKPVRKNDPNLRQEKMRQKYTSNRFIGEHHASVHSRESNLSHITGIN